MTSSDTNWNSYELIELFETPSNNQCSSIVEDSLTGKGYLLFRCAIIFV
jgi:hypothetical protein